MNVVLFIHPSLKKIRRFILSAWWVCLSPVSSDDNTLRGQHAAMVRNFSENDVPGSRIIVLASLVHTKNNRYIPGKGQEYPPLVVPPRGARQAFAHGVASGSTRTEKTISMNTSAKISKFACCNHRCNVHFPAASGSFCPVFSQKQASRREKRIYVLFPKRRSVVFGSTLGMLDKHSPTSNTGQLLSGTRDLFMLLPVPSADELCHLRRAASELLLSRFHHRPNYFIVVTVATTMNLTSGRIRYKGGRCQRRRRHPNGSPKRSTIF